MKKRRFIQIGKNLARQIGFKEGWILIEETNQPGRVRPIRQATRLEEAFLAARLYIRQEWPWPMVWALMLVSVGINLYLLIKRLVI